MAVDPTHKTENGTKAKDQNYVDVRIKKSSLVYQVERSYVKLDDILSYIGGLFSLIFFVVAFILGSFN